MKRKPTRRQREKARAREWRDYLMWAAVEIGLNSPANLTAAGEGNAFTVAPKRPIEFIRTLFEDMGFDWRADNRDFWERLRGARTDSLDPDKTCLYCCRDFDDGDINA